MNNSEHPIDPFGTPDELACYLNEFSYVPELHPYRRRLVVRLRAWRFDLRRALGIRARPYRGAHERIPE